MTIFHVIKYPVEDKIVTYLQGPTGYHLSVIPEIIREKFYHESKRIITQWARDHRMAVSTLAESLEKLYIQLLTDYNGIS